MKQFCLFSYLCVAVLLSGCADHSPENTGSEGNPEINLNLKGAPRREVKSFENLFDNFRIIKLQPNDSTHIVSVSKVILHDSILYVLDKRYSQLYAFDMNGKQLVKYGNVGLGVNEYKKISDFDIYDNKLAILSNDDRVIIHYDLKTGKYLKRQASGVFGSSLVVMNPNEIYIYTSQNNNDVSKGANIVAIDSGSTVINRYFPYDTDRSNISLDFTGFFGRADKSVYFGAPFDDLVYKLDGHEFKPYADFGISSDTIKKYKNNFERIVNESVLRNIHTRYAQGIFLKNNKYLVCGFQDSLLNHLVFYDLKNKTANVIRKNVVVDPQLSLLGEPMLLEPSGTIVFTLSSERVFFLKTSYEEIYAKLQPQYKALLKDVSKSSNQMLVLCTTK